MHFLYEIVEEIIKGGPVMIPLCITSLILWSLIIENLLKIRESRLNQIIFHNTRERIEAQGSKLKAQGSKLKAQGSKLKAQSPKGNLKQIIEETSKEKAVSLKRYLPAIGVLASICPLLGLLGTVSGMVTTFDVISVFGLGDPQALAGGISEALLTTQTGLVVAIPGFILYGYISSRIDRVMARVETSVHNKLMKKENKKILAILASCIILLLYSYSGHPKAGEETHTYRHTWEMPEVVVTGEKPRELREEQLIGSYRQPRWTAHHQNITAVYVRPEGLIEMLYWLEVDIKDDHTEIVTIYEVEIGLPYRLQLDLFLETEQIGDGEPLEISGQSIEMRYAFADWDKIWGNPTIYLEYYYTRNAKRTEIEPKLLLGGELKPRWHWGFNILYEREFGGGEEEVKIKAMLSRTIIDETLSLGLGGILEVEKKEEVNGEEEWEAEPFLGPRVRWSPLPALHLDLALLVGGEIEEEISGKSIFLLEWEF